jgi:DNA-3-methyladenine glycosylase
VELGGLSAFVVQITGSNFQTAASMVSSRQSSDQVNGSLMPRIFFDRHPRVVARQLLGKILVRREDDGTVLAGRIVETEAYLGADDAAAHAAAGKTQRNSVLFGPSGHAYVYFTYGMHYCMNVSCEPEGRAGCVLLRALEPVGGIEEMVRNRKMEKQIPRRSAPRDDNASTGNERVLRLLCSGPARLCQALGIDRSRDNGKDLLARDSDLQLWDDGYRVKKIVATPRIGITKSAELPLRFYVAGSPYISRK